MKKLLRVLLVIILLVAVFVVPTFAQGGDPVLSTPSWVVAHWKDVLAFVLALYELVARTFPTVNSYSILTWVVRIIRMLLPDKAPVVQVAKQAEVIESNTFVIADVAQHV